MWVLLAGDPSEVPAWYFPDQQRPDDGRYDPALLAEIDSMRGVVGACFQHEGWPDTSPVRVGFEVEARVSAEGGWHYFR